MAGGRFEMEVFPVSTCACGYREGEGGDPHAQSLAILSWERHGSTSDPRGCSHLSADKDEAGRGTSAHDGGPQVWYSGSYFTPKAYSSPPSLLPSNPPLLGGY